MSGYAGAFPWRVRQGVKGPADLVLELRAGNGWRPVPMALVALALDFLQENEERLYPPPTGLGRRPFFDFCRKAIDAGYETAVAELELDKQRAAERRLADRAAREQAARILAETKWPGRS